MTTTFMWATSLLPPALRRAASGAYLDLKGLPGRVRDPSRWREPWQVIHNVGGGAIAETALAFPAMDCEIDVALATSVFSHMRLESIRHYLDETYRVLKPGGRFMFTAFALIPKRVTAIEAGKAALAFQPWDGGAMVVDPRSPERAIAHPQEALEAAVREAGLDLPGGVVYGGWLPPTHYAGGQDLFVAVKP